MEKFALSVLTAISLSAVALAKQPAPMIQAQNHLEHIHALLVRPNVPQPGRHENELSNQLTLAATNLDEASNNKGSYLPAAKKAIDAAQAELALGDDEIHRAKALEYVIKAEEEVKRAWATRPKKR